MIDSGPALTQDYRKPVEGACVCLKAFRGWDEQSGCEHAEKHMMRDCCKHYSYDGVCKLPHELNRDNAQCDELA